MAPGVRVQHQEDQKRLERALEIYLRSCYQRRSAARVTEFAASLNKSVSYLERLFASVLGQTVLEALRARQVGRAEQLLRSTSHSTAEIAVEAAFGTPATFHRVFLALRRMTPEEYRERFTKR